MISKSYNSQRGTMLIVAVVASVFIGGLCAAYLMITNASFSKTKSDTALFHSKTYGSSGLTAALAKLKTEMDTDWLLPVYNPLATSLTTDEKLQLLGDGHDTEVWKKHGTWNMSKNMPGGSFRVDLYMKEPVVTILAPQTFGPTLVAEDATTKTLRTTVRTTTKTLNDMLLVAQGAMANFNSTSSKAAFYHKETESYQDTYTDAIYRKTTIQRNITPPSGKMGAITFQANDPGQPLPGDLGLFGVEVEVNGINGQVRGYDHGFDGVQRTDADADHNYGITTNTTTTIEAVANAGTNHIVGSPSDIATGIGGTEERDFLDKLVTFASTPGKADHTITVAPGQNMTSNTVFGTSGAAGDYDLTYIKIGSGGTLNINSTGTMAGVVVIECDGPITGTVFNTNGGINWEGLVVLKLNGDIAATAANQDIFNFGGNPNMLGSIAVRFNFDSTPSVDLGTDRRHNSALLMNGTPALKYSSVAVGKALSLLYSKSFTEGSEPGPDEYMYSNPPVSGLPTIDNSKKVFNSQAIIER